MEEQPNLQQLVDVFGICEQFINEQRIWSAETISQSDRVIENAYEFIEKLCDIVGYKQLDD